MLIFVRTGLSFPSRSRRTFFSSAAMPLAGETGQRPSAIAERRGAVRFAENNVRPSSIAPRRNAVKGSSAAKQTSSPRAAVGAFTAPCSASQAMPRRAALKRTAAETPKEKPALVSIRFRVSSQAER